MGTSFSKPIERFFRRIEEDREFFCYYRLNDEESMELARDRAMSYMTNAIDRMMLDGRPEIDFADIDEDNQCFNQELTSREIYLLSNLMYEYYLDKDISKLKTWSVNYTSKELTVFSPSEARNSFYKIYEGVCAKNELLLDTYRNTDRLTGEFRGIDYSSYDEGDES